MPSTARSKFPYSDVIITGGSSGIGDAFITTIRNANEDTRICNLSRTAPSGFSGNGFKHIRCDLADAPQRAQAWKAVESWLHGRSGPLLLINNAGFGSYGEFIDCDLAHEQQLLEVNCRALVELTHRALPLLRNGDAIVNVASTAAWQPTPYLATYGASKAFVLHWSLALREELKPHGITVMALCPGPTESKFFQRAGFDKPPLEGSGQTSAEVAEFAIRSLARGAVCPVSGWKNKILVSLSHALPKRWQAIPAGAILRRVRRPKN